MPLSDQQQLAMARDLKPMPAQLTLFFPRTSLHRILDAVRTTVLKWALDLEEQGVRGEGLSFTSEEREAASKTAPVNNYFYGPVYNPQIQQGSDHSVQISTHLNLGQVQQIAAAVRSALGDLGLSDEQREELLADVTTVESQAASPNPKQGILRESLGSIRRILEAAGGTIAGQLFKQLVELGISP